MPWDTRRQAHARQGCPENWPVLMFLSSSAGDNARSDLDGGLPMLAALLDLARGERVRPQA